MNPGGRSSSHTNGYLALSLTALCEGDLPLADQTQGRLAGDRLVLAGIERADVDASEKGVHGSALAPDRVDQDVHRAVAGP